MTDTRCEVGYLVRVLGEDGSDAITPRRFLDDGHDFKAETWHYAQEMASRWINCTVVIDKVYD